MAMIEVKKTLWGIGASVIALERWLRFAPRDTQAMINAGTVATTAAVKTKVMIKGGLVGSDLKIW